jgi:class 3 adenylate cyclase
LLGRKELLALLEGADTLNETIGLPEVLHRILLLAQELTGAVAGSVILHDARKNDLYFAAATGPAETTLPSVRFAAGHGYAGKVFASGKPIRENELDDDRMHYKGVDRQTSFVTKSVLCVPLVHGKRRYGVMQLLNKRNGKEPFSQKDEAILMRFAVQATIAIRNAALFERLLAASGLYAAPDVRADIVERMMGTSTPAVREFLTVLFVDLRGSTQLAQYLGSPDRLQRMISELLAMLSTHVIEHRGIVNKFLGDGLMAVFRREGAASAALRAAFAMLAGFEELIDKWRAHTSLHLKFLGLGIGIVSEEVILGTVGTEEASDFTVIGTPVNLAAALTNAARDEKHVMCCSQTYQNARHCILEADGPVVFELRKPTQAHGIEYEVFHVKSIRTGTLQPRAFVSFSHSDRDVALRRVVEPLKKRGVDVFSFAESIPLATDWHRLIEEELERCDWFLVVVSPHAVESEWVRGEVANALGRKRLDGRIVPLTIGGTDMAKVDLRLGLLQGLALDDSDAPVRLDALAVHMVGGGKAAAG